MFSSKLSPIVVFMVSLLLGLASCKKNEEAAPLTDLRDSVYAVTQEWYLWQDNLPKADVFKPLSYDTPEDVIAKVRTYSPFVNGKYQDRFSFVIEKSAFEKILGGTTSDVGATFDFVSVTEPLRVKLVYSKSSAGLQGVQRGWKVLKINGVDATFANREKLGPEIEKASQTMVFERPDGTQRTLTLTQGTYQKDYTINPKTFSINGNNVGYFALDAFLGENDGQQIIDELNKIFTDFKAKNVTDLVVDLRYNGGGNIRASAHLANLIAPASASGKVFSRLVHNARKTDRNRTTNFAPLPNGLGLSKVTFIVTEATASACEELIVGLRPMMNVKLVGSKTTGKAAGFFAIPTMNYYSFPISFKVVNSVGFADYYDGLTVDKEQGDDITKNFGDPEEACLKVALNYIRTGVLQSVRSSERVSAEVKSFNERIAPPRFQGSLAELPKRVK
jgi:carboxyl-terminal processing protease